MDYNHNDLQDDLSILMRKQHLAAVKSGIVRCSKCCNDCGKALDEIERMAFDYPTCFDHYVPK
jgi:hypothetical protein